MHKFRSAESVLKLLQAWVDAGWIRALDLALARFLSQQLPQQGGQQLPKQGEQQGEVLLLAALVSHQVGRGHICLPLLPMLEAPAEVLNLPLENETLPSEFRLAELALKPQQLIQFERALAHSEAVGRPDEDLGEPLVYDGEALYLRRFWQYEWRISNDLRGRMNAKLAAELDHAKVSEALNELFPLQNSTDNSLNSINWQKLACAIALRTPFSVITGGPGTGKTYSVVRLLAMLQRFSATPLRIKLAAPTGKAAARLKESIQTAVQKMASGETSQAWSTALQRIQSDSSTLHKLLGVQRNTRKFKHNAFHQLNLDVLVIDEASMIDIEMMDAILAALPAHARLILLGDKDQLASVEAGAVLAQLCANAEGGHYQNETFEYLQSFSQQPLPTSLSNPDGPDYLQHVVMLRTSRRFNESSGIGHLAAAINNGDAAGAANLFTDSQYKDIHLLKPTDITHPDAIANMLEELRKLCQQGFKAYWQVIENRPANNTDKQIIDDWARKVLQAYSEFQLLTPVREGDFGVEGLNQHVPRWLKFLSPAEQWYEGRPVMVTENDYSLNLRNGDIGMVLVAPYDNRKRVVFIDNDGQIRWLLPSRLRSVQTVFAMTVHKSQGSEFKHAVMVIPNRDNPGLTRELVYTGVTRAAEALTLVVPKWQIFTNAINRQIYRAGKLRL